jgi:hypothetical protein
MSRAQEQEVADTSSGQNKQFNTNAQSSFQGADASIDAQQGDIGAYQAQLAKFAAGNPYSAGGAYQTDVNKATAGATDAASEAAKQAAQAQAVRTGLNASGGVAAGEATDQANARQLMTTQAKANADRISQGANYGSKVLSATALPASLQGAVTGEQGNLARTEADAGNTALSIDQKASEDPSFMDVLGENYAKGFGSSAGAATTAGLQALAGCWIAAELYGGWFDPRTQDVRRWIFGEFSKSTLGFLVCALYVACGERVAGWIHRWPVLHRVFLPIFNRALAKSREVKRG